MSQVNFEELPVEILDYIVKLRKEAANYRRQRTAAREELAALKVEYEIAEWTLRGLQAAHRACCEHHTPLTEEQIDAELEGVK